MSGDIPTFKPDARQVWLSTRPHGSSNPRDEPCLPDDRKTLAAIRALAAHVLECLSPEEKLRRASAC